MKKNNSLENWLRGKIEGVPDLFQPAAHALLQTKEEAAEYLIDFPDHLLWQQPAGRASVGFHLQHIAGVTNRLLTYAKGEELSKAQLDYLKLEGVEDKNIKLAGLLENLNNSIDEAVEYLKKLHDEDPVKKVEIGRRKIPSTLIGVLFHAAEHSQRHIGQMLVTISVVQDEND